MRAVSAPAFVHASGAATLSRARRRDGETACSRAAGLGLARALPSFRVIARLKRRVWLCTALTTVVCQLPVQHVTRVGGGEGGVSQRFAHA
eukprot:1008908-Pleurochrysis_carterae.AAC.8